jgi:hypothetical protein
MKLNSDEAPVSESREQGGLTVRESGRLRVGWPGYKASGASKVGGRVVGAIRGSLLTLVLSGCAGTNPFLSSGPNPRAEECAQIQQATPTRYVCGGKIYTSIQLTAIREGKHTSNEPR